MIWQLLQVRRLCGMLLIIIGEMWSELIQWAKDYMLGVEPNLANPVDLAIAWCVAGVDKALAIIHEYSGHWLHDRASTKGSADGSVESMPRRAP